MRATFAKLQEPAYFLLRFLGGLMFACHGAQKLLGMFGGQVQPAFSFLWFGGVVELGCGVLVALGLFTRVAAFLASGEMAVAFFKAHVAGDFSGLHILPIMNKGEMAALYCFLFLYLCGRGPGKASLDRLFRIDG